MGQMLRLCLTLGHFEKLPTFGMRLLIVAPPKDLASIGGISTPRSVRKSLAFPEKVTTQRDMDVKVCNM